MHVSNFVAIVVIALFYLMQAGYGFFVCSNGVMNMWILTTIALMPAFSAILIRSASGAIGACCGQLPFVLWANYAECMVPHTDAAMAYVAVFLFGIPFSVLCAFVSSVMTRKKLAQYLEEMRRRS